MLKNAAKDEELTRRTLTLLGEMKIKFPGKTEEEALLIINHVSRLALTRIARIK